MDISSRANQTDVKLISSTPASDPSIDWVSRERWIDYPIATKTFLHLQQLMDHPRTHRPPCCLMVRDTNNGKTMIARQFVKKHNESAASTATQSEYPIAYVQSPPAPSFSALCTGLLKSVNAPTQPSWTWKRSLQQIVDLFPRLNVQMIMIDEIHNLLQGSRDHQELFLNGLKYLTNELQVPIVAIGTKNAETVFQTDQQFGNRFRTWRIPRWEPDHDYAIFLHRVIKSSDSTPSEDWKDKRSIQKAHTMSEGLTGETVDLIRKVAGASVASGNSVVEATQLTKISWVKPNSRRAEVNRH